MHSTFTEAALYNVLQFVILEFLVHLQKDLVLQIVIWGFLVHGVRITGVRIVTRTNPD